MRKMTLALLALVLAMAVALPALAGRRRDGNPVPTAEGAEFFRPTVGSSAVVVIVGPLQWTGMKRDGSLFGGVQCALFPNNFGGPSSPDWPGFYDPAWNGTVLKTGQLPCNSPDAVRFVMPTDPLTYVTATSADLFTEEQDDPLCGYGAGFPDYGASMIDGACLTEDATLFPLTKFEIEWTCVDLDLTDGDNCPIDWPQP